MPGKADAAARPMPAMPEGSNVEAGIKGFEAQGFVAQFGVVGPGQLRCYTCRAVVDAADVRLKGVYRVEGISDPGEEAVVAALECPNCDARGTCTFSYGPDASKDDAVTFGELKEDRQAKPGDPSATGLKPPQGSKDNLQ